jgi:hypothetical protein
MPAAVRIADLDGPFGGAARRTGLAVALAVRRAFVGKAGSQANLHELKGALNAFEQPFVILASTVTGLTGGVQRKHVAGEP